MRPRLVAVAAATVVGAALVSLLVASAIGAAPRGKSRPSGLSLALRSRPALVGGFDNDIASGRMVNLTPYTWTLVGKGANDTNVQFWDESSLPATVKPGQAFVYRLRPQQSYGTTRGYNGWFTYRADALNHAEYLTLDLEGSHCTFICLPRDGPALVPTVYNATRAPQHNNFFIYDFGPATANPEIGSTASGNANVWPGTDSAFDFTFQTKGTFTLDAANTPPQLAALINAMCAGAAGTTCSFASTGNIGWGIGDLDKQASVRSCGAEPPGATTTQPPLSVPPESPDWHSVSVEVARTRSVSVGGSLTGTAEVDLFGVIDSEVSAKVGIEHEWSNTTTFEKTTKVAVPQDWIAAVWVAPVVGTVSGTLVVKTALASYTITNFKETASGVSKDLTTPAFDIMTSSRPMTAKEYEELCPKVNALPPTGGLG
jgi:hypothetical protein